MGCGASKGGAGRQMTLFGGTEDRDGEGDDGFEASSFEEAMERLFPLSFEAEDWLDTTQVILGARGFTKENSLACISACRDILAVDLVAQVNEKWADANGNFPVVNGSSIAGFLALGKTGLRTLLENAPPGYDRDRYGNKLSLPLLSTAWV